jgi:hypothetical protein
MRSFNPNKDYKCKVCKGGFKKRNSLQVVCSPKCAITHAKRISEKKEKQEQTQWNIKKRSDKKKLEPLRDKLNKLQRVVNAIARWIDTGHPCISSGRTTGKINGGHFWPVSTNRHIRFHLMNIFLQSESDNNYKGGNISEYREGLKNTFGEAVLAEIEDLKNKYKDLKLQSFEVDEKIVIARSLIKQMKAIIAEKKKLTNEERLSYRHLFNKKIGIYK